ncbi:MAG: hypothetical protein GXY09_11280 [Bacteroidales bacterium]|nr:hypothetical protein [Bacteroidales bacterium]
MKYLIDNYGIEKLKALWATGMTHFENITALSFHDVLKTIETNVLLQHPHPIALDWKAFEKACY